MSSTDELEESGRTRETRARRDSSKRSTRGASTSTLQALSAARKGGNKRTDQFEVKKAERALVDEDKLEGDAAELEKRRRRQKSEFLEDEYGNPIPVDFDDLNANLGDVDYDEEEEEEETSSKKKKANNKKKGANKRATSSNPSTPSSSSRKRKANPSSPPGGSANAGDTPSHSHKKLVRSLLLQQQPTSTITSFFGLPSPTSSSTSSSSSSSSSSFASSSSSVLSALLPTSSDASSSSDLLSSLLSDLHKNPLDASGNISIPTTTSSSSSSSSSINKKKTLSSGAAFSFFDNSQGEEQDLKKNRKQEEEEKKRDKKKEEEEISQPSKVVTPATTSSAPSASNEVEEDLFSDEDDALLIAMAEQAEQSAKAKAKFAPLPVSTPKKSIWSDISDEEMIKTTDEAMHGLYDCLATTSTTKQGQQRQQQQQQQQKDEVNLMEEEEEEEKVDERTQSTNDNWVSFYYLDACEERAMAGSVILFGKVWSSHRGCYESCCVIVKEVERQLLVAPRRGLKDFMELYSEWNNEVRPSVGISSLKMKKVTRQFAWEHEIRQNSKKSQDNDDHLIDDEKEEEEEEEELQEGGEENNRKNKKKDCPPIGESSFLKVHYSFKDPEVSQSMVKQGGRTYSKIYGSTSSALELFLLKRKVKGPSWLQVKLAGPAGSLPPRDSHKSWCKHEWSVDLSSIRVAKHQPEAPPLLALSLSVRHYIPETRSNKQQGPEVVMVSGVIQSRVGLDTHKPLPGGGSLPNFTILRRLDTVSFPRDFNEVLKKHNFENRVTVVENEKTLLEALLRHVEAHDPDILVGHELVALDIDLLLRRMNHHSISQWSKLGRLHRSQMPKSGGEMRKHNSNVNNGKEAFLPAWFQKSVVSGRLVCDTAVCSKELIRERNYSLTELAKTQLEGTRRDNIDVDDVAQYFKNNSASLLYFLRHCLGDAILSLKLMDKLMMMTLFKQLTNISGNLLSRSLMGGRAERIEYLLLHEFYNKKFVLPDKADKKANEALLNARGEASAAGSSEDKNKNASESNDKSGASSSSSSSSSAPNKKATPARRKPKYDGGLVLEPQVGLHDKFVLLLDFVSLYPSIIREYNVCFTTFRRDRLGTNGELIVAAEPPGVLPALVASLVQRRRTVKSLLNEIKGNSPAEQEKKHQLDIKQRAIKLTANSLYGCLGFVNSRFFCLPLAEYITRKGRENLKETKSIVELQASRDLNTSLEVIYGDTDSIMIKTQAESFKAALTIGRKIKELINKKYKSMEIEVECVFKTLLLRTKKKYAALKLMPTSNGEDPIKETKGLDLVRRDWCDISKDVGHAVLDQILSGKSREEIVDSIHELLRKMGQELREGKVPVDKFVITKGISKNPEEYPDAKSQAHIQVALKLKQRGIKIKPGDHIPYVICKADASSSTPISVADRACSPDQVKSSNGLLQIDTEWYLTQQIHPPVLRLCESIYGIDAASIAHHLGMDESRYSHAVHSDGALRTSDSGSEVEFVDVDKLVLLCTNASCRAREVVDSWHRLPDGKLGCPKCKQALGPKALANQVTLAARRQIDRYYEGSSICIDCRNRTRQLHVKGGGSGSKSNCPVPKCLVAGCKGVAKMEVTEKQLWLQLKYYRHLFTSPSSSSSSQQSTQQQQQQHNYNQAAVKQAQAFLNCSEFNQVDLNSLFSCFRVSAPSVH